MKSKFALSWVLVSTLPFAAAGCRFGNKVENPQNPDKFSGYYQTEQKSLALCSYHPDNVNPNEVCKSQTTDHQPDPLWPYMSNAMTSPLVFFYVTSLPGQDTLGVGHFVPYTLKVDYTLPVAFDPNGVLSLSGAFAPTTFFLDDGCRVQRSIDEQGTLTRYPSPTTVTVQGVGLPAKGEISVDTTIVYSLIGNCAATLSLMQSCYGDVTKCGSTNPDPQQAQQENIALNQWCVAWFQPYIDAQTMTAADIPKLQAFGYEVSYK